MTEENIEKLSKFANEVNEGNLGYYKLMEEFGKSKVMQKHFTDNDSSEQPAALKVVQ